MEKPLFKYINEPVKVLGNGNYQTISQRNIYDDTMDIRQPKSESTPAPVSLSREPKPYTVLSRYPLIIRWNDGRLEEIPSGILPDDKEKQKEKPAIIQYQYTDEEDFENGKKTHQNRLRIPEEDDFTSNEIEDSARPRHTMEYRFPQPKPKSALSDFQKKRLKDRLQQIAYLQRQQDMQDDYTTQLYGKKDYQSEREELEAQLEAAGELLGRAHMPGKKEDDESKENKIYLKNKKKQEEESKSSSEKDSSPASSSEETPEKVQEAIDNYKRENPKEYKERLEELKRNGSEEFQPEQTDHGGGSVLDIAKNTGKYTLENVREKVNSMKESGSNFVNSIKSFFAGKEKTDKPTDDSSNPIQQYINQSHNPKENTPEKLQEQIDISKNQQQTFKENGQPFCNAYARQKFAENGKAFGNTNDKNNTGPTANQYAEIAEKDSSFKKIPHTKDGKLDHNAAAKAAKEGKLVAAIWQNPVKTEPGHIAFVDKSGKMEDSSSYGVKVPVMDGYLREIPGGPEKPSIPIHDVTNEYHFGYHFSKKRKGVEYYIVNPSKK